MYHIGEKIKELSEKNNLTVIMFAAKMKLSHTAIYNIYKDKDIHTKLLKKISDFYGVDMKYWFDDNNSSDNIVRENNRWGIRVLGSQHDNVFYHNMVYKIDSNNLYKTRIEHLNLVQVASLPPSTYTYAISSNGQYHIFFEINHSKFIP